MIKKQLLLLIILISSYAGYSQTTVIPQWKPGVGYILVYYPGKSPSGYDTLDYRGTNKTIFWQKIDTAFRLATQYYVTHSSSSFYGDKRLYGGLTANGVSVLKETDNSIGISVQKAALSEYTGMAINSFTVNDNIGYSSFMRSLITYKNTTGGELNIQAPDNSSMSGTNTITWPLNKTGTVALFGDTTGLGAKFTNAPHTWTQAQTFKGNLEVQGSLLYIRPSSGTNPYVYADNSTINAINAADNAAILLNGNSTTLQYNIGSLIGTLHADGMTANQVWQLPNRSDTLATKGMIAEAVSGVIGSSYSKTQTDSLITSKNEQLIGSFYGKTTWTNLSDFTDVSSGASISGGKIVFGAGSNTYSNYLTYNLNGNTVLEKYRQAYKLTTSGKSGTTYGIAFGTKSALSPTVAYNVGARIDLTNTGTSGQLTITGGASDGSFPVLATSTTNVVFSSGDQLEIILERNMQTFTMYVRNITQNSNYTTLSYDFPYINSGTVHLPNTSSFAIYNLGGSTQIDSASVSSTEIKNASGGFFGDSKFVIGSTFLRTRASNILQKFYSSFINLSGSGDNTTNMLSRINEALALRLKQVIICAPRNDIAQLVPAATWQANYASIVSQFQSVGTEVFYLLPLWEPGLDQTAATTYINANYPSDHIINVNITSADLSYDNIHLNDHGHLTLANGIIAANVIKSPIKISTYDKGKDNSLLTGDTRDQTVIGSVNASGNLIFQANNSAGTKGYDYFGINKYAWFEETNGTWMNTTSGIIPSILFKANYIKDISIGDASQIVHSNLVSSNTATDAANYIFQKTGGTSTSPTAAGSADVIGTFRFDTYDGSALRSTASISAEVDGTVSSGNAPAALYFSTGLTTSRSKRWEITSGGTLRGLSTVNALGGFARAIYLQQTLTPIANNDQLIQADFTGVTNAAGTGLLTTGITNPGTGYNNGTYPGVAIGTSSGGGTGAIGTVTVAGGAVTSVVPTTGGINYTLSSVINLPVGFDGGSSTSYVGSVTSLGYTGVVNIGAKLNTVLFSANTLPINLANGLVFQSGSRLQYRQSSVTNTLGYNVMTSPGDMTTGGASGLETRIPANTTTTPKALFSTGNGTTGGTPVWTDPYASPALTGVPTAPTAAAGTNTTQLATTAHVFAERTNTATLTNKTLTSPQINNPLLNTTSVIGQVWTATNTGGAGGWATASVPNRSHTLFAPTTGGTVNTVVNQDNIINPAGALATLTINLPSSPANNDKVFLTFTQAVTAISYTGGTVVGVPVSASLGSQWFLTYDTGTTTWY